MEQSFKKIVQEAQGVLILLPADPTFDYMAAGLSLYLAIKDSKDAAVSSPSPVLVEFNRLVGVNKVSQTLGKKNLLIRFNDYDGNAIERVKADMEGSQFFLTVFPKSGQSAPKPEQIEMAYSGVSADTVVLVGGDNVSDFPALEREDLSAAKIVHIGTRDLAAEAVKPLSFAKPASSVTEVTAQIIKKAGYNIDSDLASNLLMGIDQATRNFTQPGVSADTFEMVAFLMRKGGKRTSPAPEPEYPQGAIPGQDWYTRQQARPRTQPQRPIPHQQQPEEAQESEKENPPEDWFGPKIYKGTSVS